MKAFAVLVFSVLLLHANQEAFNTWVKQTIDAIKAPRKGVSTKLIKSLHDPFVLHNRSKEQTLKPQKKVENRHKQTHLRPKKVSPKPIKPVLPQYSAKDFHLQMIFNKRAKIDGTWYNKGQTIRGFTLAKVRSNFVQLQRNDHIPILLYLHQNHDSIKFNTQ